LADSDDQGVLLEAIELGVASAAFEGERESQSLFLPLLVPEPIDVAAMFPGGDVGGVHAGVAELIEFVADVAVFVAATKHLVDFFADFKGQPGDFASPSRRVV